MGFHAHTYSYSNQILTVIQFKEHVALIRSNFVTDENTKTERGRCALRGTCLSRN